MDPFLGEVRTFPWSFAPKGWAFCNGQLMPINQYQALFALLGTTYGGDGRTTFGLPNLQGRTPLHFGSAQGIPYAIGNSAGAETVTLAVTTMPPHTHAMNATTTPGDLSTSKNGLPATVGPVSGVSVFIYANASPNVTLAADTVGTTGGTAAHNNMQPFLALNFCIALQGIFPSRN